MRHFMCNVLTAIVLAVFVLENLGFKGIKQKCLCGIWQGVINVAMVAGSVKSKQYANIISI